MNILTISAIVISTIIATLLVVKGIEKISDYAEEIRMKDNIDKLTMSQVHTTQSEIYDLKRQIEDLKRKNLMINKRQVDMHFILLNIDSYKRNYEKLLREREDDGLDVGH